MGDPLDHAKSSAKKFGGLASDYIELHKIMDSSKLFLADWRHRAIMHNTFGVYLMENYIIGPVLKRASDDVEICTRTICTQHIMEDLNTVPTLGEFLREMPLRRWMMKATSKEISMMKKQTFSEETQSSKENAETKILAGVVWYKGNPEIPGWYLVDRVAAAQSEARGCPALYYLEGKWYIDTEDMVEQTPPTWWACMPVDPILDGEPEMGKDEHTSASV